MDEKIPASVIVVGAGLAGLFAAHILQDRGHPVTLLEKSYRAGGRMATRRLVRGAGERAVFDHGAQYFTVRDERFQAWVSHWLAEDVVMQWSNGFATPEGTAYQDGHPRYRGNPDMEAIPQALARGLDVRLEATVASVTYERGWRLRTTSGDEHKAQILIMTPPVPQTLALLTLGQVSLPAAAQQALAQIDYDPCFAVLAVLAGPSAIPDPGGLWPAGPAISWMADNWQKGVSSLPAVTIHGSPDFSRAHFDEDPEEVARLLLAEAAPWLGSEVVAYRVKRWRYSIPVSTYPAPCLAVDEPGPLIFAGDAFAGPRVEGAALSGLAAATAIDEGTVSGQRPEVEQANGK